MGRAECFIDTNILLHYKPLDAIDWLALTGASEVVLSIPAKVISELDEKKELGATSRLRQRAKDAQRELRAWKKKGGELRAGVTLRMGLGEPKVTNWDSLDLDEKVADDRIIAAALTQCLKDVDQVFLVTGDFGPELKCERHNLLVLTPAEDDRLPELMGEQDKKVVELQSRLDVLERKEPKLKLELVGEGKRGPSHIEVVFHAPVPFLVMSDDQIEKRVKEEEAQLLGLIPTDLDKTKFVEIKLGKVPLGPIDFGLKLVPEREAQRFRDSIPTYLDVFRSYLHALRSHYIRSKLTAKMNCILVNDGYAPADGVEIALHIPDGPEVFDDTSLPKPPAKPAAPAPPRTNQEMFAEQDRSFLRPLLLPNFDHLLRGPEVTMPDFGPSLAPRITKTKSYDLVHEWPDLRHHDEVTFEAFYCSFPTVDAVQSFAIEYQIHARNLAEPVKNTLSVIFRVEPAPPQLPAPEEKQ